MTKMMGMNEYRSIMRRFTVIAFDSSDMLSLNIKELFKMKLEFPVYFK